MGKDNTKLVGMAFIWSAFDNVIMQIIGFAIGILMARQLLPSDYGLIGMISIFTSLSMAFIDSGFSFALIQYKDRTSLDYSTVFFINAIMGLIFCLFLVLISPFVASFYGQPILETITCVVSFEMILSSLTIVQRTKLIIDLKFKSIALINMSGSVIGGITGLLMAYSNHGVWALVCMGIANKTVALIMSWWQSKWIPQWQFSKESFKRLFGFGSKILITGLYGPIFTNLSSVIIGKKWSATALGYYSKAYGLSEIPAASITSIISRVSFPVLSKIQDNDEELREKYRFFIRVTYSIVSPVMMMLIFIATPLINFLLTEKWLFSVPYFKVLCMAGIFYPICAYNINALLVKGKATLHLYLDLIKKVFSVVVLIIAVNFDIMAICFGVLLSHFFSWILTASFSGRIINLSFKRQILDIGIPIAIAFVSCLPILFVERVVKQDFLCIIVSILIAIVIYIILTYLLNKQIWNAVIILIKGAWI